MELPGMDVSGASTLGAGCPLHPLSNGLQVRPRRRHARRDRPDPRPGIPAFEDRRPGAVRSHVPGVGPSITESIRKRGVVVTGCGRDDHDIRRCRRRRVSEDEFGGEREDRARV